jgi:hypothetical protein
MEKFIITKKNGIKHIERVSEDIQAYICLKCKQKIYAKNLYEAIKQHKFFCNGKLVSEEKFREYEKRR